MEGTSDALYEDILGFCKTARSEEVKKQDYILTPGRYVGLEELEDDGEPFEEKMERLTTSLSEQFKNPMNLKRKLSELLRIGYEI